LSDIPGIGEIFFSQNIPGLWCYLLVPLAWFVLNKDDLGLKIRVCGGENPDAAIPSAVSVHVFDISLSFSVGHFPGIAGASLSIAL